jgi:hypothetical protein
MKSLPNIQEDNRIAAEKSAAKERQKRAEIELIKLDRFLKAYQDYKGGISVTAGVPSYDELDYMVDDDLEAEIIKALQLKRVFLLHQKNGAR